LGVDIICEKGAGILHSIRASSFLLYLIPAQLVLEGKFETGRRGSNTTDEKGLECNISVVTRIVMGKSVCTARDIGLFQCGSQKVRNQFLNIYLKSF
jgi:hypothetical protein